MNNKLRKTLTIGVGILALSIAVFTAFSNNLTENIRFNKDRNDKDKINLQLGWVPNGQYSIFCSALVNGYYDSKNLDVEIIPGGPSGANFIVATTAIAEDDNLDIGVESDMVPILKGVARENKDEALRVKVLATFWKDVPLGFIVRKDSGIRSLEDLGQPMENGKMPRIGVTADFVLKEALADYAGVDKSKLNFVTTSFDPAPFINGQLDAFAGYWTNQVYSVEKAGIDYNFLNISELPNFKQPSVIIVATDKKIAEKRDQIQRFLEATEEGTQFVTDNPEIAAEQITDERCGGKKFDVNQETWLIKRSLPLYEKKDGKYGNINVEKLEKFAEAFYELDQIPYVPNSSKYIDTTFYEHSSRQ